MYDCLHPMANPQDGTKAPVTAMKKILRNAIIWPLRIFVLGLCGAISTFLLASGYESLYNRSLPFVHTLDAVTVRPLDQTYDLQKGYTQSRDATNESIFGTFGKPITLKLPQRAKKLDIVMPIHPTSKEWLARADTLHLLAPQTARNGNLGVALMYCRSSFRTIDPHALPAEGSNLFMDTDQEWRYVYKVTSTATIPNGQRYVPADNRATSKLLIICDDRAEKISTIIEANLLSVQGLEQ